VRWSTMHIPTLRDDPAEAGAPSHRLLLRAGYIRQLMAGHYSLLPLAVRVRLKVIGIIREEMNRIGAQEFLLPVMHPAEIWQRSGRFAIMGDELFKLHDRKGAELVLGMTHEEVITSLAGELNSYRELPQMWYQFQTKMRDEPRPKAGLMRTREFTMKDSYSFDLDSDGLDRSFDAHRAAYVRSFERMGIPAIPVAASNGAMGGSGSTEFVCPSETGEDNIIHCPQCGYAANIEAAVSALAPLDAAVDQAKSRPAPERFDTPGVRTIEDLATGYDALATQQVKTLVYVLDGKLTLVLLRGDHALEEQKLIDATGSVVVRPAEAEEIFTALGAHPGSLGAVGVTRLPVIADSALRGRTGMTTGANTDDVHLRGVDVERDIEAGQWADLRAAEEGEPCTVCGGPLSVIKGIEVGHIFKLGYKYTDAFDITVSGPDGKPVRPIMGCYGIGVERAIAACIEVHHDDKGIVWPLSVAPFEAVVVVAQQNDAAVAEAGERAYAALLDAGVDVIIDDRPDRAGVKFSDAELVGIPLRVTIGKRGLASGTAELTTRAAGETVAVPLDEIAKHVSEMVAAAT
jgi:prolyl-tRNA synthetase